MPNEVSLSGDEQTPRPAPAESREAAFSRYEEAKHECGSFALPCCDYCADDFRDWRTDLIFETLTEENHDD